MRRPAHSVAKLVVILISYPGLSSAQVKEAARAALGATEQLATIARGELREVAPLLQAAYPISFGEGG